MSSLQMPIDDRRRVLRRLQVKWHPDNFPGEDKAAYEAREFAGVIARIANEAATQAKNNKNRDIRAKKKREAYEAMQAAMPARFSLGKKGGSNGAEALREAIAAAKEAGVSLVAIRDAENALSKMEARSPQ